MDGLEGRLAVAAEPHDALHPDRHHCRSIGGVGEEEGVPVEEARFDGRLEARELGHLVAGVQGLSLVATVQLLESLSVVEEELLLQLQAVGLRQAGVEGTEAPQREQLVTHAGGRLLHRHAVDLVTHLAIPRPPHAHSPPSTVAMVVMVVVMVVAMVVML